MYQFCPFCRTLLLINRINGTTSFYCRTCSYSESVGRIHERIVFDKEIKERIVWKGDVMRSMAKCEKMCEKCGYNTASFYEMQTRSADEPMTIFYQCLQCKNTWKE